MEMNEIVSGPVSAVPLTTTHKKVEQSVVDTSEPNQKRVIQEVTVVDTYDWRGNKSSATKVHTLSWLV
jgi:hypothetical protein|tara:strand:- start:822 stop:1025 length:204 start_codon:yes stop_codon:yes gene_type:complete